MVSVSCESCDAASVVLVGQKEMEGAEKDEMNRGVKILIKISVINDGIKFE